ADGEDRGDGADHRGLVRPDPIDRLGGDGLELVGLAEVLPRQLVMFRLRHPLLPNHILYLKSSGDIFSRISAHLSRDTLDRSGSRGSSICWRTLDASSTGFAT